MACSGFDPCIQAGSWESEPFPTPALTYHGPTHLPVAFVISVLVPLVAPILAVLYFKGGLYRATMCI